MTPHLTDKEAQALGRLLRVAQSNTGQSATVANFLLAWWNANDCGGFAISDLWGLDDALCDDIQIIIAFVSRKRLYPDSLGLKEEFVQLVTQWRPHLHPPSVLADLPADDGRLYPARLVTYGESPGYRDVTARLALRGEDGQERMAQVLLKPQDAIDLMQHILSVNRLAWSNGRPIDATATETRPAWLIQR